MEVNYDKIYSKTMDIVTELTVSSEPFLTIQSCRVCGIKLMNLIVILTEYSDGIYRPRYSSICINCMKTKTLIQVTEKRINSIVKLKGH